MKNIFLTFLCFFSLTACALSGQSKKIQVNESETKNFQNKEIGYSIDLPAVLIFEAQGEAGPVFDTWNVNHSASEKDFSVEMDHHVHSCNSSITGVSQMSSLSNIGDKTQWGRVDAFDSMGTGAEHMDVVCRPPVMAWRGTSEIDAVIQSHAYALCSQKDDKTVLICISQMTDNPALAEEIFRSFRWLDE